MTKPYYLDKMGLKDKSTVVDGNFKKVLMIAFAFPPMGGAGVQRSLKFAKYLPDFHWLPVIIKADLLDGNAKDYSFLKELNNNIKIHNSFCPQLKFFRNGRTNIHKNVEFLKKNSRFINNLIQMIKTLIFIPDRNVAWLPFVLIKAIKVIKEDKIDLIYTTSDPYADHLIGYLLKKLTGKPWVADFRDPWTDDISHSNEYYQAPFGKFRKRIDLALEKKVIKHADCVVGTTEEIVVSFLGRYPKETQEKCLTITNGYDEEDFLGQGRCPSREDGRFTICYSGSFARSPDNFLVALKKLLDDNNALRREIRVIFAGYMPSGVRECIGQLKLEDQVDLIGYVPHKESIEYLLRSDVLLLNLTSDERERLILPGKIFEYMRAKKPILALVPKGAAAEIINKYRIGNVVDPDNVVGISNVIEEMYYKYKRGSLKIEPVGAIDNFERKKLTRKLADCFNELIEAEI